MNNMIRTYTDRELQMLCRQWAETDYGGNKKSERRLLPFTAEEAFELAYTHPADWHQWLSKPRMWKEHPKIANEMLYDKCLSFSYNPVDEAGGRG